MKNLYITLFAILLAFSSRAQILGTPSVCVGSTTSLSDPGSGGSVWASSNTAVATIGSSSGILTGITAGTVTINESGPLMYSASIVVTVNPNPLTPTVYPNPVCLGSTSALTDVTPGGTWSSAAPAVAAVDSILGTITTYSPGTVTISYILGYTGCYVTATLTVNVVPAPITVIGSLELCVYGGTATLSDAVPGGTWTSSSVAVAAVHPVTGVVSAVTAGTATISYSIASGCSASVIVTVDPSPAAITGPSVVCTGSTISLTDATPGGSWSSSTTGVGSVSATGAMTGYTAGTTTISYYLTPTCASTVVITVNPAPAAITGSPIICYPGSTTFMDATPGGYWYTSTPGIVTIVSATGVATGVVPGTATVYYTIPTSCIASVVVTVEAMPAISAGATVNCGGTFSLTGSGAGIGGTYLWSPGSGLSCSACASPTATIASSATYSLIGTAVSGCYGIATVTLDADRISGYISLTAAPTDTLKVWLIQFNPSDSSLIAEDSTLSCVDDGTPYYEFAGKPAGSYMVKAKLLSSIPGTSGYVPTYGLSSNVWDSAATITHMVGATDTQHINMIYGTVPSGPGFIGGLISSGAGRGTSGGVPVEGMLVYLKDAATNAILTYTYTDAAGAYSFSGIANGSYTIYPVDYHYSTIPWAGVTLSTSAETATGISFYQHTVHGTITPLITTPVPVCCGPTITETGFFPNPACNEISFYWKNAPIGNVDLRITDITGREVYHFPVNVSDHTGILKLNISSLNIGIYVVSLRSKDINYMNKLTIQK